MSQASALTQFIRRTVYSLKRAYGIRAVLYRRTSSEVDLETGVKTVETEFWPISKLIVLPSDLARTFFYDLTFIATNKQFTYGVHADKITRRVVLDRRDLPSDFIPSKDDYWVLDGIRYEISHIEEFEHKAAIVFVIEALVGQTPYDIEKELIDVSHDLEISDGVEATLN